MRRALTLIELLVVVAILATIAGSILVSQAGVEDRAGQDITRSQLSELREAILRFRKDTGHLPKQGPYALQPGGEVEVPAGDDPIAYAAWFNSPANLSQLYRNPLPGAPAYDPDTRRGWRGPYLGRSEHLVSLGDDLLSDGSAGTGTQGTRLANVPALADSFNHAPVSAALGLAFAWTNPAGALPRGGRPLLLFSLDDPASARIVSCGSDGSYAPYPPATGGPTATGSDDLGVFLLR